LTEHGADPAGIAIAPVAVDSSAADATADETAINTDDLNQRERA
jgi:hypothetical protein